MSLDGERLSPPVPHLGRRTEEAFAYALALHGAQVRKRAAVPYLSHLLAVASIVLEDGGDEDATVAALLHDAVEDQGGLPRLEDIEHRFGSRVAGIVKACSDSLSEDPAGKAAWEERKRAYLDRLRDETDASTLRVVLADKLHNARCVATDASRDPATWARYNAAPDRVAWYYGECLSILRERHGGSRFIAELELAVSRVAELAAAAPARGEHGRG